MSVNKTKLDFSLILCNALWDQQCKRKCQLMYLFFVHSYVASKIEKKEKMEEKVTMGLKINFSNR